MPRPSNVILTLVKSRDNGGGVNPDHKGGTPWNEGADLRSREQA